MKIIYLTSDGRAVCSSKTVRTNSPQNSFVKRIKQWKLANYYSLSALRYIDKEDFVHVKYDTLCNRTNFILATITEKLNIPQTNISSTNVELHDFHVFAGNPSRINTSFKITEDVKWKDGQLNKLLNAGINSHST